MKYAKKMKLVEIDDASLSPSCANNIMRIDDDSYSKPSVMSTLDNTMNEILRLPISDVDKWKLYSQALQRYLNHSKFISGNYSHPVNNNESKNKAQSVAENSFNFPFDNISIQNQFDMSGLEPIRDSIDSISQPSVRNFFEKARESNSQSNTSPRLPIAEVAVQPPQRKKKKPSRPNNIRRVLPYRKGRKRQAETSLSADMSHIRPCKVIVQRLQWSPTTAR